MIHKTHYSYRVHIVGNPTPVSVYADDYHRKPDEDGLGDRFEFTTGAPNTAAYRIVARFSRDKVAGVELYSN